MPIPIPEANITFNKNTAILNIREFNKNSSYLAAEWLVRRVFSSDVERKSASASIVVINSLMNAGANKDDLNLICQSIFSEYGNIFGHIGELQGNTTQRNPSNVCNVASNVFGYILEIDGLQKRWYSLATKYLHWASRGCTPIVDSLARKTINRLQQKWIDGGENKDPRSFLAKNHRSDRNRDYQDWVNFYSALIKGLPQNVKRDLIAKDWGTQRRYSPQWAVRNTLPRILDKYFWMAGKSDG